MLSIRFDLRQRTQKYPPPMQALQLNQIVFWHMVNDMLTPADPLKKAKDLFFNILNSIFLLFIYSILSATAALAATAYSFQFQDAEYNASYGGSVPSWLGNNQTPTQSIAIGDTFKLIAPANYIRSSVSYPAIDYPGVNTQVDSPQNYYSCITSGPTPIQNSWINCTMDSAPSNLTVARPLVRIWFCNTAGTGDFKCNSGAGYWSQFYVALKVTPVLTFTTSPPSSGLVGGSYNVGGSSSELTHGGIRTGIRAGLSNICTISGTLVSLVGAGTCVVELNQSSDNQNKATDSIMIEQSFTVSVPQPTVSSISPNSGTTGGGASVTITGANLSGASAVTIGGTAVSSYTVVSATSITAITPAHAAGSASVVVTTLGGSNAANSLYTYQLLAPTVTGISPNSGTTGGGASVTITGTNLTGATGVTIGGTAVTSYTVVSTTSITATTPAHAAGTASVVVTTPAGVNAGNTLYTYQVIAPTVASISPNSGSSVGGASVTIIGNNFSGATGVTIGGTAVTSYTVNSITSISTLTPVHPAGSASVVVTTMNGSNAANTLYSYVEPPVSSDASQTVSYNSASTAVSFIVTNSPTSISVISGALHGSTVITGASVTYRPTVGYFGPDSFTYTASNAGGASAVSTVSITVSPPTLVASPVAGALNTVAVDNPFTQTFTTSGGASPYTYSVASGALPPGLTFVSSVLSGTPTTVGVYNFALSVQDSSTSTPQTASTAYSLTVSALPVPVLTFTTPVAASVLMGGALTNAATSTLSGGSFGGITYSSSNTAVATVSASGVVTPVSAGTSIVTASQAAVTGVNIAATQTYTLTIALIPSAALTAAASPSSIIAGTGTATLSAAGGSGTGSVIFTVTSGACTITGTTLTAGVTAGNCVVTATRVSDGIYAPATGTVTIIIEPSRSIQSSASEASVYGVLAAQAAAAQKFANTQTHDISDHLEVLRYCNLRLKCNNKFVKINIADFNPIAPAIEKLKQEYLFYRESNGSYVQHHAVISNVADTIPAAYATFLYENNRSSIYSDSLRYKNVIYTSDDEYHVQINPVTLPALNSQNENGVYTSNFAYWVTANVDSGTLSVAGISGVNNKSSGYSATMGVDYQLTDSSIVGLAMGYGFDAATIDSSGSKLKSSAVSFSGYGMYRPSESFYVDGLIGSGKLTFTGSRFSTIENKLFSGDRIGDITYASIGLAESIRFDRLSVVPFARINRVKINLTDYAEQGGINALAYDVALIQSNVVLAGASLAYDIYHNSSKITPTVKLQISKSNGGQLTQNVYFADVGSAGGNYYLSMSTIPQLTKSLGLGATFSMQNGVVFELGWLGTLGSNYKANSVKLSGRINF